ncbi:MAG: hypothetical protein CVU42_12605 [Chloroflexi bacterium HGW-Chloroflexi-4]|jgi:hypothetical protein|nr:MAG: hypothetical protein CVU42_12605 [Chloroflexi bacterium HGW-Chloroflexi-4]
MIEEYTEKNLNCELDVLPQVQREIERAISFRLMFDPARTIQVLTEKKVEPSLDIESISFFQTVKPLFNDIERMDLELAAGRIFKVTKYKKRFWNICQAAFEQLNRPDPDILATDLIAVRSHLRSGIYIQNRKLVENVFWGRVKL